MFQNLVNDPNGGGLFTVGMNDAGRQKIPNTACGDFNPAWSNDNQFIAYGALFEACGNNFPPTYPYFVSNIYKIRPDTSGKQQLTDLPNTNCRNADANCLNLGMVWTEDNAKIIAAGRINNVKGLFAINANGGVIYQIPISNGNAPDFVGGIVQPRVERNVISFGGGVSTPENYTLVSTIGAPDGRGLDAARKTDGNGLANMQTRTRSKGGKFELESVAGSGTTIKIFFPQK